MYARHWSSLAAVTLSVLAGSLWAAESSGQAAQITFGGKILDRQGRPVSDAKVVLYEVNYTDYEKFLRPVCHPFGYAQGRL